MLARFNAALERHLPEGFWSLELRCVWWVSLAVHLITAFFAYGWHHPDEHYQILEFMDFKRRGFPAEELAWEFGAQIRPWLQPWLTSLVVGPLDFLGLRNPFHQATVLRFIATLSAFASTGLLLASVWPWLQSRGARLGAVFLLNLAWFVPYFHSRPASENASTVAFVIAVALILRTEQHVRPHRLLAVAGLAVGFAFELRFQTGFMIAGFAAWLLVQRRFAPVLWMTAGVAVMLAVAALVDRWGYGEWVFPPWNYLHTNLVAGRAANFGVEPWWWYLVKVSKEAPPPFGVLLMLGAVAAWARRPMHPFTWIAVPFFLVHCLISHKELRFLLPLSPFVFVQIVVALEDWWTAAVSWLRRQRINLSRPVLWLFLIGNTAMVAYLGLKPTHADIIIMKALYTHHPDHLELYTFSRGPYRRSTLTDHFYAPASVTLHKLAGATDLEEALRTRSEPFVLYYHKNWLPESLAFVEEKCAVIHRSFPTWLARFNVNDWVGRTSGSMLLECQPMVSQRPPAHAPQEEGDEHQGDEVWHPGG
jgi:phosphatidylinositol glycan class B